MRPATMEKLKDLAADPVRFASASKVWHQCRPMVYAALRKYLPFITVGTEEYAEVAAATEARLWELSLTFEPERGFQPATYLTLPLRQFVWYWWRMRNRKGFRGCDDTTDRYKKMLYIPLQSLNEIHKEYDAPLANLVPDHRQPEPTEVFGSELLPLLRKLTKLEQTYLKLHFGEGLNLKEAGERMGRCRENARQTVERALRKLRHGLEGN